MILKAIKHRKEDMIFLLVLVILIAILTYWAFGFSALAKYAFAVLLVGVFYILTPSDTTEFPWEVVFFCSIIVMMAFIVHFWTKPKEIPTEKLLYPSEQAYQEWWESKIDPEIKDYIEETYGIRERKMNKFKQEVKCSLLSLVLFRCGCYYKRKLFGNLSDFV